MKRNMYIDTLKGIAAIGIIAIHTAFWSGSRYTPEWFYNATLLLDVPFFFYLSGWASSYQESDIVRAGKSLWRIWLRWVYFISVLALFCKLSVYLPIHFDGVADMRELFHNFMFKVSFKGLPVVGGSIWFMPVYVAVIIGNTIVMMLVERSDNAAELKRAYMCLLTFAVVWVSFKNNFFGLNIYFLFYSLFWMLGMNRWGVTRSKSRLFASLAISVAGFMISSYIMNLPFYIIQAAKFPPSIKYIFASLPVILISKYLEPFVQRPSRVLAHIGENALFYFFAQGVGSSLIYRLVNSITMKSWLLKWIVIFSANVFITLVIAEALAVLYAKMAESVKSRYGLRI